MERVNQSRIIRKSTLEKFLIQIKPNPKPKSTLEQYPTSIKIAAKILHSIAYSNLDIPGKTVLDLGCGTGRFTLGAAFLGAQKVENGCHGKGCNHTIACVCCGGTQPGHKAETRAPVQRALNAQQPDRSHRRCNCKSNDDSTQKKG